MLSGFQLDQETDAALCEAIAYVLITENMVDQAFLDKYCIGYDEKTLPASAEPGSSYKSYILGLGKDHTPKKHQNVRPRLRTSLPTEL